MDISKEKKIEILYNHYKDTFLYIREYLKQRERFFFLLIIVIFLLFLQISFSSQSLSAFNTFIENKIGFNFAFNENLFNGLVWFILFSISLRYFQINVLINRQYDYLHFLEDKLCIESNNKDYIRREGYEYLKNYPILSDWAHIIYTWILPILLIVITLAKIILEITVIEKYGLGLCFNIIIFVATTLTVVLYLINIHKKKQKIKKKNKEFEGGEIHPFNSPLPPPSNGKRNLKIF